MRLPLAYTNKHIIHVISRLEKKDYYANLKSKIQVMRRKNLKQIADKQTCSLLEEDRS